MATKPVSIIDLEEMGIDETPDDIEMVYYEEDWEWTPFCDCSSEESIKEHLLCLCQCRVQGFPWEQKPGSRQRFTSCACLWFSVILSCLSSIIMILLYNYVDGVDLRFTILFCGAFMVAVSLSSIFFVLIGFNNNYIDKKWYIFRRNCMRTVPCCCTYSYLPSQPLKLDN